MQNVFEVLKPPFRYDPCGQMIFDSDNNLVLDVRAWGFLQYKENGEKLQDAFGEKVAEGINYISQLAELDTDTQYLQAEIDVCLNEWRSMNEGRLTHADMLLEHRLRQLSSM